MTQSVAWPQGFVLSCSACGPAPLGGPWGREGPQVGRPHWVASGSEPALPEPASLQPVIAWKITDGSPGRNQPGDQRAWILSKHSATSPGGPRILGGVRVWSAYEVTHRPQKRLLGTLVGTLCVWFHGCTDLRGPGSCGRFTDLWDHGSGGGCSSQHSVLILVAFTGPLGTYVSSCFGP